MATEQKRNKNPVNTESARINKTIILPWIFTFVILALIGFNIKLGLLIKSYVLEKEETNKKLTAIQEALKTYGQQTEENYAIVKNIGDAISRMDSKIKESDAKISQLEEAYKAQLSATEMLAKANNTLLDKISFLLTEVAQIKSEKISSLEAEINQLKSGKISSLEAEIEKLKEADKQQFSLPAKNKIRSLYEAPSH